MPTFELDEVRQQAARAMRYFAEALTRNEGSFVALRDADGVVLVIAKGTKAERLRQALEHGEPLGFTTDVGVELVTDGDPG